MPKHTHLVCLAFSLALPLAACGGDDGGGDAALLSAFPDQGFIGRSTSVVLFGENANFSNASAIDFGAGITVRSAMAVGTNGLIVEIAANVDAEPGPRSITVDGLTLADGFSLTEPVEVEVLGTPAQGSYSLLNIKNLDTSTPFDITTNDDGEFINLEVVPSIDSGSAFVLEAAPFELQVVLRLDVNAPPGPMGVDIKSGPAASAVTSRASVDVVARTPMTLTSGTVTGSVANGYESVLYQVSAEQLTAVFAGAPDTATGTAFLQILGPSGSFSEPVGAAYNTFFGPLDYSNTIPPGETLYVILWDGLDAAGYQYSFDVELITASSSIDHAEPNDTRETAQLVATPGGVLGGSFASESDEDWYKIEVAAGDVGKRIKVVTGGRSLADPVIQIFGPDGTTSLGGPEDDAYFDRLISAPTTQAGTHYVRITSSDYGPTVPNNSNYSVVIALE